MLKRPRSPYLRGRCDSSSCFPEIFHTRHRKVINEDRFGIIFYAVAFAVAAVHLGDRCGFSGTQ